MLCSETAGFSPKDFDNVSANSLDGDSESECLEDRIEAWLYTRGVTIGSPEDKKEAYFEQKRKRIPSRVLGMSNVDTAESLKHINNNKSSPDSLNGLSWIEDSPSKLAQRRSEAFNCKSLIMNFDFEMKSLDDKIAQHRRRKLTAPEYDEVSSPIKEDDELRFSLVLERSKTGIAPLHLH